MSEDPIVQSAQEALAITKFETSWRKKLQSSQQKTREWLFRHAVELYEFQRACADQELRLPNNAVVYFSSHCEEWLGYSKETSSEWATVGRFIHKVSSGELIIGEFGLSVLPASKKTLRELARMSAEELAGAITLGLITPQLTWEQVNEYRQSCKVGKKEEKKEERANEKERTRAHEEHKKAAEDATLQFEYDDNVPEWIICKIEDMAIELGKRVFKESEPLKMPGEIIDGQESIWVCTLKGKRWTATQYISGHEPKSEERREKPKHEPAPPAYVVHAAHLGIIINKEGMLMEPWAVAALAKAAKQRTHPDKGGTDEEFNAVTEAEQFFSR